MMFRGVSKHPPVLLPGDFFYSFRIVKLSRVLSIECIDVGHVNYGSGLEPLCHLYRIKVGRVTRLVSPYHENRKLPANPLCVVKVCFGMSEFTQNRTHKLCVEPRRDRPDPMKVGRIMYPHLPCPIAVPSICVAPADNNNESLSSLYMLFNELLKLFEIRNINIL